MSRRALVAAVPAAAFFAFSCTGSDSASVVAPAGPPVLAVDSLLPAGGPTASPDDAATCLELGHDASRTVTVLVRRDPLHPSQILNFTLAAPFACVGTPQCGYLQVTVDPDGDRLVVIAAAISVDLPLARLARPEGDHDVRVELRNSDGTPTTDGAGKPYVVTFTVHAQSSCGGAQPTTDGGAPRDAAVDATPAPTDAAATDATVSTPDGAAPPDAAVPDATTTDSGVTPPADAALPPQDAARD